MLKKSILAAALVLGAVMAFGGNSAEAGCGYGGYGGGYGYNYYTPVYRTYHVHTYQYAPVYTIPAYGYGCYGW